jgi:hypothetical protein
LRRLELELLESGHRVAPPTPRASERPVSYEFCDTAFGGLPGWRVYVYTDLGLIVVFDRGASCRQLWHLDPALSVTSVAATTAVAAATGTRLVLRQVPLPRSGDRAGLDGGRERVGVTGASRSARLSRAIAAAGTGCA